jgi:hypothetical protein
VPPEIEDTDRTVLPLPVPDDRAKAVAEPTTGEEVDLVRELQLAFAPIHKRAFGAAVGTTLAVLIAAITALHVVLDPEAGPNLDLFRAYFFGYEVSWAGVAIGAFWAFVVGFVAGWFAAFCRNLVIAVYVFITRTKAELGETRDFLDHI